MEGMDDGDCEYEDNTYFYCSLDLEALTLSTTTGSLVGFEYIVWFCLLLAECEPDGSIRGSWRPNRTIYLDFAIRQNLKYTLRR